eukprot:CAMPEP_0167788014 /NCGR_PEP_ID=MMETSP0111_2-20121227/9782_1 /TAXON_ID=91324 /ORGANISM="Lotharella globosa, Strain CCCM811" /LENGTH=241 /DNA_ID=CAMNT_0007679799 /DNA_START=67 /DNA_END=792 /DNA_ORIENTATION=+
MSTIGRGKGVVILSTSAAKLGEHDTGVWLEEVATPYYLFKDAGLKVTLASIAGGEPPVDKGSKSGGFYTADCKKFDGDEEAQKLFKDTVKLETLSSTITDYDALYLAGGHGTCTDFVDNKVLDKAISDAYASGKTVVAADCHGPVGICGAVKANGEPLVKGLEVSGFTDSEEKAVKLEKLVPFMLETKLKDLGGKFKGVADWQVCVSCDTSGDGVLVTGQNPGSSLACAQKVLEQIKAVSK